MQEQLAPSPVPMKGVSPSARAHHETINVNVEGGWTTRAALRVAKERGTQ